MRWTIRPESDQPIYEQIVDQVVAAIADERLAAGELIPSVRELAESLLVNPNTVARAYQELERQGVVTVRRGLGMEVTAEAPTACRERRGERAAQQLRDALAEALAAGLAPDKVREQVEHFLTAPGNGHASRRPREKRR
jgi:GntR family transcriptional regulator